MTETVPKGSGQLDPETAAKLRLQIEQARQAASWGREQTGDRLKDYALLQLVGSLESMAMLLGDSEGGR